MTSPGALAIVMGVAAALTSACAAPAVRPNLPVGAAADANALLARDTSLSWNSDVLYQAAVLHASPGHPAYDPDRAAELLTAFGERFPTDPRRREASERLALVNEVRSLRAELRALKAIDLARPPR